MSQAQDLQDCIYMQCRNENITPSGGEQYFRDVTTAIEWDEGTIDAYASGLYDRLEEWYEWCNGENIKPTGGTY